MKLLKEFAVKGCPSTKTAQQKGARVVRGYIVFYEKPEVREAKDELKWQIYSHAPVKPYEGSLCLRLLWLFDKKSLTTKEENTFHITRPDVDNLAKGVIDVFTECGFWVDDSQVSKLELTKGWSRRSQGLYVQIWRIDQNDFDSVVLNWRNRVL